MAKPPVISYAMYLICVSILIGNQPCILLKKTIPFSIGNPATKIVDVCVNLLM